MKSWCCRNSFDKIADMSVGIESWCWIDTVACRIADKLVRIERIGIDSFVVEHNRKTGFAVERMSNCIAGRIVGRSTRVAGIGHNRMIDDGLGGKWPQMPQLPKPVPE